MFTAAWLAVKGFTKAAWAFKWVRYALAAMAVIGGLLLWHNSRVDDAVQAYASNRDADDVKARSEAEGEARIKTDQNATAIADAQKKAFEQGKKDAQTIESLRDAVRAGTVRLCQYSGDREQRNANVGGSVTAGDGASGAEASGSLADTERVIRLGEIALDALNDLEEAQAVITADRAAVNSTKKAGEP
jgi:hypothetical protein